MIEAAISTGDFVGMPIMSGGFWFQRKADECSRSAENSQDPCHRSRMQFESKLWRQIAKSEAGRDEAPPKSIWLGLAPK
jgi:hypothetical protein